MLAMPWIVPVAVAALSPIQLSVRYVAESHHRGSVACHVFDPARFACLRGQPVEAAVSPLLGCLSCTRAGVLLYLSIFGND